MWAVEKTRPWRFSQEAPGSGPLTILYHISNRNMSKGNRLTVFYLVVGTHFSSAKRILESVGEGRSKGYLVLPEHRICSGAKDFMMFS